MAGFPGPAGVLTVTGTPPVTVSGPAGAPTISIPAGTYVGFGQTLPTVPVICAASLALTTSLAAISGSWLVLDPASYPATPAGLTGLQYRVHAIFSNCTAADVVGVNLIKGADSSIFLAEFTLSAPDANGIDCVSAWTAFPVARTGVYCQVRNQTSARGIFDTLFAEVRYH